MSDMLLNPPSKQQINQTINQSKSKPNYTHTHTHTQTHTHTHTHVCVRVCVCVIDNRMLAKYNGPKDWINFVYFK